MFQSGVIVSDEGARKRGLQKSIYFFIYLFIYKGTRFSFYSIYYACVRVERASNSTKLV